MRLIFERYRRVFLLHGVAQNPNFHKCTQA